MMGNPFRTKRATLALIFAIAGLAAMARPAAASLSRNAAGARNIGETGRVTLDTAGQFEGEADGKVLKFETGVQYQLTNRLQILAEGVLFERQQPDEGDVASGLGDTDATMSWLMFGELGARPSAVLGAKVKLPTAGDELGTGKADYSGLLVLGRESGELEISLELEWAKFGSPEGESLKNQWLYTLTAEYGLTDFMAVYAEAFGNSPPISGESRTDAALFGIELDVQAGKVMAPYISFELDTEGASSARAGVEWAW